MNDPQIASFIRFVRERSPFYRALYAGLPEGVSDLAALPLTDHTAYWAANTLDDSRVLTGPHTDGIVIKTGGTTGAPRVSVYTRDEWRAMSRRFGDGLAAAGLVEGDRVANLFYAGELYSSFVFTLNCLQEADVPTVQLPIGGAAALDYVVGALRDCRATVVAAPPTSLCRLAREVVDTVGTLPGIRLVLFSGEAFYGDQVALLAKAFPEAAVRSIGYASVDAGILAAPVAGEPDTRVHEVFSPDKVVELLDAETGEPIEEPGRPGRLVATDLVRRLMPVIRYPAGDIAEWVDVPKRRFRLLGRSEEGARVGPVTVYLEDLRAVVERADEQRSVVDLQVVLRRRDARDELVLRLAAPSAAEPAELRRLEGEIARQLDAARPIFPEHVQAGMIQPLAVEWVAPDALAVNPRTGKLIRLIDERLD
ncbi:phenylacetate--CoA ligase family protein [Streptacidiphilus sp. PB12-B1b]|uniref:phenylacetate--CoA ligase family protein n=1 Tax=Streptacidiphilus sp. PB12-B1b TaxID=2705012 RepID=UPI0015FC59A4|nr:phenylacetate--CoA ligase family protein [Streptacidiphilus sp. PB12-B1b]QMU77990.1 phenylacetate--CoA ligase family protein [Streptacidiphilus sp. PB12-B1b]